MKLARITNEQLHITLAKLAAEALPLKTAFKLKGLIKQARAEFDKYEEVRREAIQRHGKKNAEGQLMINEQGNAEFEEEGIKAFVKELNELGDMDIELPAIKASELGDNVVFSCNELEILDGIIVED
jgi:hypothetical protein